MNQESPTSISGESVQQTSKITSLNDEIKSLNSNISNNMADQDQKYQILRAEIIEELKKSTSFVSDFSFEYGKASDGNIVVNFHLIPNEVRNGELFRVELWSEPDPYPIVAIFENTSDIRYAGSISIPINKEYKINIVSSYKETLNVHKVNDSINPANALRHSFYGSTSWRLGDISKDGQYVIYYTPDKMDGDKTSITDVVLYIEVNNKILESFQMKRIGSNIDDTYSHIFEEHPLDLNPEDEVNIYATAKDSRGFNYKWIFESFIINSQGHMEHIEDSNIYKTIIY